MSATKQPTWNEIRSRAHTFVAEWKGEERERAEKDSFWNDFFHVFGVNRRRFVTFEKNVTKLKGTSGYIDGFWPGMILVEQKSRGKDLDKAIEQARGYLDALPDHELPQFLVVSDFLEFRVWDLDNDVAHSFLIDDLPSHVEIFAPLAGYRAKRIEEEDEVNVRAAALLGLLHDELDDSGYSGHQLRLLLVRLLFLLFADDTGVWEKSIFSEYLRDVTADDGRDLGMHLQALFEVLDTPVESRQAALDESLAQFPYINGDLFAERVPTASFDRTMRATLLNCCRFDWSAISPAIFGSVFQSVMEPRERRQLGAHYTTERDILKVIDPLFVNGLRAELTEISSLGARTRRERLVEFKTKLASLTFFDPACGCGNFLLIAYREIRQLELDALVLLRDLNRKSNTQFTLDALADSDVKVDQFFGIELEEFPALIARTAMYLMDHLMNQRLSEEFGLYYARFPIDAAPGIVCDNAVRLDWNTVLPAPSCDFVFGNPPFVGRQFRSAEQKEDMRLAHHDANGHGVLDYVTCWYVLAARYAKKTSARIAFVSTNSIVQGESVGALWPALLGEGLTIEFAHRPFAWTSEAKGKAGVHVVIIGFSMSGDATTRKVIFDYDSPSGNPVPVDVAHINPYLTDGPDVIVNKARRPLSPSAPISSYGSMANDGGHLVVRPNELEAVQADPTAAKYLRLYVGAEEMLRATDRWCLWLVDAAPADIVNSPILRERVKRVQEYRRASKRPATKKHADTPALFTEIRPQNSEFLLVPFVSSELRRYLPMAFYPPGTVVNAPAWCIPNAGLTIFGVLQSSMFTEWAKVVAGRHESRIRLSPGTVYNTFPFPGPNNAIEMAAAQVLDARARHGDATLADLYNPIAMPADLVEAHNELDRAVDFSIASTALDSDEDRFAAALTRYSEMVGGLA